RSPCLRPRRGRNRRASPLRDLRAPGAAPRVAASCRLDRPETDPACSYSGSPHAARLARRLSFSGEGVHGAELVFVRLASLLREEMAEVRSLGHCRKLVGDKGPARGAVLAGVELAAGGAGEELDAALLGDVHGGGFDVAAHGFAEAFHRFGPSTS